VGYQKIIGDAIMGIKPVDQAIDEAMLLAMIRREIFCSFSGVILDRKSAVLIQARTADGTDASSPFVMDASVFDARADDLRAVLAARGLTMAVTDGRTVQWGR